MKKYYDWSNVSIHGISICVRVSFNFLPIFEGAFCFALFLLFLLLLLFFSFSCYFVCYCFVVYAIMLFLFFCFVILYFFNQLLTLDKSPTNKYITWTKYCVIILLVNLVRIQILQLFLYDHVFWPKYYFTFVHFNLVNTFIQWMDTEVPRNH